MLETLYINSRGQITIPSKIRNALHLKEGSALVIAKLENKIIMHPTYTPGEDIMNLYSAVRVAKEKSKNPEVAIKEAKKLRSSKNVG